MRQKAAKMLHTFGQKLGFYGNIDPKVEKAGQSRTTEKAGQKAGHPQKAGLSFPKQDVW